MRNNIKRFNSFVSKAYSTSRFGFALCVIYSLIIIICLTWAYSGDIDFKSQFVLVQLPIAVQLGVLHALGLYPLLKNISMVMAYILLVPLSYIVLYFSGWLVVKILFSSPSDWDNSLNSKH